MLYNNMMKRKQRNSLIKDGFIIGATILVYLIVQTVAVLILQKSSLYSVYQSSSLFQNAFNVIAVHVCSMLIPFSLMALILKKNYSGPLVPTKSMSAADMCAWVAAGMGLAMVASMFTNIIIKLFDLAGYKLSQPELTDPDGVPALLMVLVSTAIIPGIIEEFAMRCCTLGALKKYGKGFAVVAVSIVFGLIHGNLIQFIFAFLVGLILGYITVVNDSVIPAMLVHGLNNGVSVLSDFVKYFSNEKTANIVSSVVIYIWLGLAIVGLIYLFKNKKLSFQKTQREPRKPYDMSFGEKLLCLLPGFFIPFMILIYITTQYIQPK